MKNLLILITLTMLSCTCLCASTNNLQALFASDPEAQMYVGEGLTPAEKEIMQKQKELPTLPNCVTFRGNVLTPLCSPQSMCIAICCTLTIYCILPHYTHREFK